MILSFRVRRKMELENFNRHKRNTVRAGKKHVSMNIDINRSVFVFSSNDAKEYGCSYMMYAAM